MGVQQPLKSLHPLKAQRVCKECLCIEWYAKGKAVRVVSTHEGSGLASMPRDVKRICKGANVDTKGLAIQGSPSQSPIEAILKVDLYGTAQNCSAPVPEIFPQSA